MRALTLLILTLCVLPLLLVSVSWLLPANQTTQDNWQHILQTVFYADASNTLLLAFGVLCLSSTLGITTAWLISTYQFPLRNTLSWLLAMPLAVPAYILATAYGNLLEFAGPIQSSIRDIFGLIKGQYFFPDIRSLGGAIFILSLATYSYIYLLCSLAFQMQPLEWFEAAQNLGKTKRQLFWQMALPAARPFIITGATLSVMETLADLGAVQILGINTLATSLYRTWFYLSEPLLAGKIAALMLFLVGALLLLERLWRGAGLYHAPRGTQSRPLKTIKTHKAIILSVICATPSLLGFVIPVLWLIRLSLYSSQSLSISSLLTYSWTSFYLAFLAALLVGLCAFIMVFTERTYKGIFKTLNPIANLGYAIPGLVVAVGLLLLQGLLRKHAALPILFSGTIAGLMLAYLVRFISTAYSPIYSGYQRLNEEMDMAAISLGKNKFQIMWSIHFPILKWPMLTAALLVGIDVLKELPATLILRPYDVKTLAMAVYDFASDDRTTEAAPFALSLVFIASLAVWLLQRMQRIQS